MSFAAVERTRLRDLFLEVGPDAPTLCEGWATRDLAAHLFIRERRPDAVAGNWLSVFAPRLDAVTAEVMARPFDEVVHGWGDRAVLPGPLDSLINTAEHFIHHEDVRRAAAGWEPRQLTGEETWELYRAVRAMSRFLVRGAPVPVVVEPEGCARFVVSRRHGVADSGENVIRVSGPLGEVALWLFGRECRDVRVVGEEEALASLARSV
ncbi:MAG: TIGR03085 family metal-binding protein [Corynebacterium sp.]|nr:TIGR03085 family metal-binding protein [Corynebacterium sp.]